jgi:hypothetical protein
MPYLIRLHPGDVAARFSGTVALFTADKRVAEGSFMMLIKGNATEGMNDAEKTPQTEA